MGGAGGESSAQGIGAEFSSRAVGCIIDTFSRSLRGHHFRSQGKNLGKSSPEHRLLVG